MFDADLERHVTSSVGGIVDVGPIGLKKVRASMLIGELLLEINNDQGTRWENMVRALAKTAGGGFLLLVPGIDEMERDLTA